jgi:LAO/AO transport system kinase
VFVVNKSDRGGAELVEQEIVAMQGLAAGRGMGCHRWCGRWRRRARGCGELMEVVRRCALGEGRAKGKGGSFAGQMRKRDCGWIIWELR